MILIAIAGRSIHAPCTYVDVATSSLFARTRGRRARCVPVAAAPFPSPQRLRVGGVIGIHPGSSDGTLARLGTHTLAHSKSTAGADGSLDTETPRTPNQAKRSDREEIDFTNCFPCACLVGAYSDIPFQTLQSGREWCGPVGYPVLARTRLYYVLPPVM